MKKRRKVVEILIVVGIAAVAIFDACGGGGSTPGSGSSAGDASPRAAPPAEIERVEIPLDSPEAGEEASLARNLYFVFDGSGSMAKRPDEGCRGDQSFRTKLDGARWAVREFLAKVPEGVNLGLYIFDSGGRAEAVALGAGSTTASRDSTSNRDAFLRQINGVRAGGGTPLHDAILFATDQLVEQYKRQLGYGEFRIVVVTDGRADGIPEAAAYAARYGMPIYAIGLCVDRDHPLRRHAVSYRAADSFEDLAQGLEETLAELPDYDVTDFEPAAVPTGDGN